MVSISQKGRLCMRTAGGVLRTVFAAVALLSTIACGSAEPSHSDDKRDIEKVIKTTWEKPGMDLRVEPISVAGKYAVAGWVEQERGGRALLRKQGHSWSVILCSGDGIKTAAGLIAAGISPAEAQELVEKLASEEAALPADVVKKFSLFEGSVPVDNGTHAGHREHH